MMNQSLMKKLLISKKEQLTKQQYNTLMGQVRSGNIDGAYRGLNKLLGGV